MVAQFLSDQTNFSTPLCLDIAAEARGRSPSTNVDLKQPALVRQADDTGIPAAKYRQELNALVGTVKVKSNSGSTGSGKSTQVP